MSGAAIGWAKRQTAPCARSKSLLVMLADYADENDFAWPPISMLAGEAQLSERHVKRMLKSLVDACVLLRCEVEDRQTGRTRACAYFFPIHVAEPTAKMVAAYERKVGGRVTQVSPSEGDMGVTLEGDTGVMGRVTTVSPLNDPPIEPSEANASSAGVRASEEDPFEIVLGLWPASGLDNTDVAAARSAFAAEAAIVGDPRRLVDAVRAYVTAPETKARTYALPGLDKWLSRQSYRGRLKAAKAPRLGVVEPDLFAEPVPSDVRGRLEREMGKAWVRSYLDPCRWDGPGRSLIPANGVAATKLAEASALLKEMSVTLGEVSRKGVA